MIRQVYIFIILFALVVAGYGQWSPDFPLQDLTNAPVDDYNVYMDNVLRATDERCRATYTGQGSEPRWEIVAGSLVNNPVITNQYAVQPPLDWLTNSYWNPVYTILGWYRWPAGVTNYNINTLESGVNALYPLVTSWTELIYTNGIWITNTVTATVPKPTVENPDNVVTTTLSSTLAYVNGEYITNVVYDINKSSVYPYYEWKETNYAYKAIHYWLQSGNEATWTPDSSHSVTIGTPAPVSITNAVTNSTLMQITNVVNTQMLFRVYDEVVKDFTNEWVDIIYTNYAFEALPYTSTVVIAGVAYSPQSVTYNAGDSIVYTSAYRRVTNDFVGYDPQLFGWLSELLLQLPTNYINQTFPTNWSWVYYTDTLRHTPIATRTNIPAAPRSEWIYTAAQDPAVWTLDDLFAYTGSGTNLYRKIIDVNTNVYPGIGSDWRGYRTHASSFTRTNEGWEVGDKYSEYVMVPYDLYTNVVDLPSFLLQKKKNVRLVLGTYQYVPTAETQLEPHGFSDVMWYQNTNGNTVVVTNQEWLSNINTQTFIPAGVAWTEPYQPAGALGPVTRTFDYYHTVAEGDDGPVLIEWHGGWLLADNYTNGLSIASNWKTLYGTNVQRAIQGMHRAGYSTKVDDYKIGWPSVSKLLRRPASSLGFPEVYYQNTATIAEYARLKQYYLRTTGPSGYYFPGGVMRPVEYSVDVEYRDGVRIYEDLREDYLQTSGLFNQGLPDLSPYFLDLMTWDTLTTWPDAYLDFHAPSTNVTQFPTHSLPITGDVLYEGPYGGIRGYDYRVNDPGHFPVYVEDVTNSTNVVVSQPITASVHLPLINSIDAYSGRHLDMYDTNATISGWVDKFNFNTTWWTGDYLPGIVTTLTWAAEDVWNIYTPTVTDIYYTASYTALVDGTNVFLKPKLIKVFDVITNDVTRGVGGMKIELVVTNRFSMYANEPPEYWKYVTERTDLFSSDQKFWTGGIRLDPTAFDARYNFINALKYTAANHSWETIYPSWNTNGNDIEGAHYGLTTACDYVEIETNEDYVASRPTPWVYTTNSFIAQYGDVSAINLSNLLVRGPYLYTNTAPPYWSIGWVVPTNSLAYPYKFHPAVVYCEGIPSYSMRTVYGDDFFNRGLLNRYWPPNEHHSEWEYYRNNILSEKATWNSDFTRKGWFYMSRFGSPPGTNSGVLVWDRGDSEAEDIPENRAHNGVEKLSTSLHWNYYMVGISNDIPSKNPVGIWPDYSRLSITAAPTLSADARVYGYVDYRAHDFFVGVVTTNYNIYTNGIGSLSSAKNGSAGELGLNLGYGPFDGTIEKDQYFDIFNPYNDREYYRPRWSNAWVDGNSRNIFSTNIYSTTNRSMFRPSHIYYPMDDLFTPYSVQYLNHTIAKPVGVSSVTDTYDYAVGKTIQYQLVELADYQRGPETISGSTNLVHSPTSWETATESVTHAMRWRVWAFLPYYYSINNTAVLMEWDFDYTD